MQNNSNFNFKSNFIKTFFELVRKKSQLLINELY